VKGKFGVWVFRDEQYLMARYGAGWTPTGSSRVAARSAGRYCIVKLRQFENDQRMGDIRMGTIVDCVVDPDEPEVLDSLLRSAVALSDASRSTSSSAVRPSRDRPGLRRHAFVRYPGH